MYEHSIDRRSFLRGAVAGGALMGLGLRSPLALAGDVSGKPKPGKIGDFKLSLAEWSLHKALFGGKLDNLDFAKVAREDYDVDGLEYVNQFFKDKAHDSKYLKELKKRAGDHGLANVLIMIDGEGDLSAPDKAERAKAVENHMKWVDAAAELGCHAIRINTGSHYGPGDVAAVAEACGLLSSYGETHDIHVICENHGGPSSNPDAMLALVKAVGSDNFGTLPDFGNFPNKNHVYEIDVYEAIARMMPFAKGVSAKSHDFDADGNEKYMDFARIMKIVTDAGYKGFVGIEYEGSRLSEPEGIRATKKLLEKLRGADYAG